ncbi:MAG TPA: tetratricopeptide repeat protein [Myxococcales bacterium]|jgi:tetratricopeptide (TPR) repeat protein
MRRIAIGLLFVLACSQERKRAPEILSEEGRDLILANLDPGGHAKADEAVRKLQAAVAQRPEAVQAWIELGEAWIRKSRDVAKPTLYASAGACASRALALEPSNRSALELRGLVLMNDHRFADAAKTMRAVVDAAPERPGAWGTLSDALLELGRTGEAIEAAQRMMDLKPNLPSYSRAAHLQWLQGDVKAAEDTLRLAIDAGNGSLDREPRAWVLVQAAMIFWNEGDAEGALAGFEQALRELPDFPPALVGKGRVLIGRGDGKSAEPLLARAYRANPLIQTGWLLGDAREIAGDLEGASRIRAEIEKKGGADPRTLALFLATKNLNTRRALELALAERGTRDDEYTEDTAAWALYRAGRLSEALAAANRAVKLGTRDAQLWYHAGAIRLANGDRSGRRLIERALALNPHFDYTGAIEVRTLIGRAGL